MKTLIKKFLTLFIPLIALTLIISTIFYTTDLKARKRILEDREQINISQQQDSIRNHLQHIVTDLMVLANQHHFYTDHGTLSHSDTKTIAEDFLAFARHKKIYDQIRFLDSSGMEIIRVNDNNGDPVIISKENLQSKGQRYYFQDTINLQKGEIFVSPFDLNIEKGVIEEPRKPMIRFAVPIVDNDLCKCGIVILNYKGNTLLSQLDNLKKNTIGDLLLLNSDGYWLRGRNQDEEWGFMYKNRKDISFTKSFPEAWAQIAGSDSGQFVGKNGMCTFTTVFPLQEGLKSSTGSPEAYAQSSSVLQAQDYQWKIVSHIPTAILNAHLHPNRLPFIIINVLLVFVLGYICWAAAVFRQEALQTGQKLRENEQKLKKAQQIAKLGHWEHDIESNAVTWSDETYRIFEVAPQEFPGTFEAFMETVHPQDRRRVLKAYTESIENKKPYDIEHRILLNNGTEKWVREICHTEYNNNGKPIRSLGIVHDISEVKALRGIVPICSKCKKIRDDEGFWQQVDHYISEHSTAELSHGICRPCSDELYGGQDWYEEAVRNGEIPGA
ncbi:MAG: PAS domain-containing protein [Desulfobulbaceae bacterium]|uniref:histidine kinase n=1 Tax=Candidatus Desulfobia pelagia TaxID=2841692 RepID=A0A8J6NB75_9BACT|nr:PAS domain-containing protein [Candidatus Desulfobia pelagia]